MMNIIDLKGINADKLPRVNTIIKDIKRNWNGKKVIRIINEANKASIFRGKTPKFFAKNFKDGVCYGQTMTMLAYNMQTSNNIKKTVQDFNASTLPFTQQAAHEAERKIRRFLRTKCASSKYGKKLLINDLCDAVNVTNICKKQSYKLIKESLDKNQHAELKNLRKYCEKNKIKPHTDEKISKNIRTLLLNSKKASVKNKVSKKTVTTAIKLHKKLEKITNNPMNGLIINNRSTVVLEAKKDKKTIIKAVENYFSKNKENNNLQIGFYFAKGSGHIVSMFRSNDSLHYYDPNTRKILQSKKIENSRDIKEFTKLVIEKIIIKTYKKNKIKSFEIRQMQKA